MKSKIQTILNICHARGVKVTTQTILIKLANLLSEDKNIPTIWIEYCNWLTFANSGMLNKGNVNCMNHAIKNLCSDAPIVEIGSFCGLSTNMITYFKEKYDKKNLLISCDKWIFGGAENEGSLGDSTTIKHSEYREFVKETFVRNIKMFSRYDLPYTIEFFSDEFFAAWHDLKKCRDILNREITLGGPMSFCYIDGNHSYDYTKRDFENCDTFLEVGGFVLFDDSAGSFPGVTNVIKEVIKSKKYNIIAKNPNYFFQKVK